MVLIALDPGKTTGVAVCQDLGDGPHWTFDTWHTFENMVDQLDALITRFRHEYNETVVVVYEDFVGGGLRDANVVLSLQTVGAIRAIARVHHVEVVRQQPFDRKAFLAEATAENRHARDAHAHGLCFLDKRRRSDARKS